MWGLGVSGIGFIELKGGELELGAWLRVQFLRLGASCLRVSAVLRISGSSNAVEV